MTATNGMEALSMEEWEALPGRFRLPQDTEVPPMLASVPVSELLDMPGCTAYLDWLGHHIGSPSPRVTASMLAKRYAYLLATPVLHAMSAYNKGLLLAPGQCRLVSPDYSGYAHNMSKFPELLVEGITITSPLAGERRPWREDVLRGLFAGHLTPLFRSLSECAGVPLAILWENAAVRIAPPYEEGDFPETHSDEDYRHLASPSSAELFGVRRNPLSPFLGKANEPNGSYSEKKRLTCCFYYEMAPEYCRKCPKAPAACGN